MKLLALLAFLVAAAAPLRAASKTETTDDVDAYLSNKPAVDKAVGISAGGLHQDSAGSSVAGGTKTASNQQPDAKDRGLQDVNLEGGKMLKDGTAASGSSGQPKSKPASASSNGCPKPAPDTLDFTIWDYIITKPYAKSGQIHTAKIQDRGEPGGKLLTDETPTSPADFHDSIMQISRCPGVIDEKDTSPCTYRNKILHGSEIDYIAALPYSNLKTKDQVEAMGYCYAPRSEGPWYLNVRYFYSECHPYGDSSRPCANLYERYLFGPFQGTNAPPGTVPDK